MNMARAGVVVHPDQWKQFGYNEIQTPRKRYGLINHNYLMKLLEFNDYDTLRETQRPYGNTVNKKNEFENMLYWDLGFG